MILNQNKPAKHRKAVVFCADRNVVRFAQFVANQIILAEPDRDYDICITTFDGALLDLDKVDPEIRICQIDETPFDGLSPDSRVTSTAYILLALPEIFATEYTKILYLDADIYLNNGKMSELFAAGSDEFAVTGVADTCHWSPQMPKLWHTYFEATGGTGEKYLNTGVLVLDVEKCIKDNFFRGTLGKAVERGALSEQFPDVYFFHDQTAINRFLKGNWAPISLRWNWQIKYASARLLKYFDPHIIHFIGPSKPWANNAESISKQFLPAYKRYFKETFGEDVLEGSFHGAAVKKKSTLKTLIVQELSIRRQIERINKFNPLYYTNLRNFQQIKERRIHLEKLEKAIAQGSPIYPNDALEAGLK